MDMAFVHNRDARPPGAPREAAPHETAHAQPLPQPPVKARGDNSAQMAVAAHSAQVAQESFTPKGPGFRYEMRKPGKVEVVLLSAGDGTEVTRFTVERAPQAGGEKPTRGDFDLRA